MTISLLVPASMITDGTEVCKATGSKPYTLRRKLRIFKDKRIKEDIPEITTSDGIVFLVSEDAINCIPETVNLKMSFDSLYEAKEFIEEMIEDREDK